jgi:hypothetical protein
VIRVIIPSVISGIIAVPVPVVVVVIAVPGPVPAVVAIMVVVAVRVVGRAPMPGIKIPGIPVPGVVETVSAPGTVIPGIVVPRIVIRPVIISHIPRPEGPGIVPGPGRGIPNRYGIVVEGETDVLTCRNHKGVSGAKDISLGGVGIGQQVVQFFIGRGRLLGHNGRTGVDAVVKSLALKTACGRA